MIPAIPAAETPSRRKRYIDYLPSCRRLMTLLETHRSFPFSKLMARRSRLKRRM
jgi:hypothetical protein